MNFDFYILLACFTVVAIIMGMWIIMVRNKNKQLQNEVTFIEMIINDIRPSLGLEKNLDLILNRFSVFIEALEYSFYVKHPDNDHYVLKAVRKITDQKASIEASYSGLLPYQKSSHKIPLALSKDMIPLEMNIVKVNGISVLMIPIRGGNGVIQIAPFTKLSKNLKLRLIKLSELLEIPIYNLMDEERQKREYEILVTSTKAVKYISKLMAQDIELIKLITNMTAKSLNSTSNLLISLEEQNGKVVSTFGLKHSLKENDYLRENIMDYLLYSSGSKSIFLTRVGEQVYQQLNEYCKETTGDTAVISKFNSINRDYIFISWYESKMFDHHKLVTIKQLVDHNLNDFLIGKQKLSTVESYMTLLKKLSDMIDNLSPYTVGYSQLMSRYSMLIAKEMGLSSSDIFNIGQAAYLSNIGLIGLSEGLLFKDGKYTEDDYEQMKLHSEVGATIIENTIAHSEIADIIRYHHERIDGNGYPHGLKGDTIPDGSKIIAVVQTFLAKFNGRAYRDPLPFSEALSLLKKATNGQLDPNIVDVFIKWFDHKRYEAQSSGNSLGACWEMCCTPEYICSQCDAFGQTNKNCWEFEKNNCIAHGKECKTCFVYTEAATRNPSLKIPLVHH